MPLPTSRNTNYAPGVPVESVDLNDIQDQIIARFNNKHGPITLPCLAAPATGWNASVGGVGAVPHIFVSTIGSLATQILPVPEGDRVTAVKCKVSGDGSADVTIRAFVLTSAMSRTQIGTVTVTNQSSTWAEFSIGSFTATVVPVGGCVFIEIDPNATGIRVSTISTTFDCL